jgi:RNA polymerase sigma-54 factor
MFQTHFQTQSIRPLTTAHLAQTMTLLSLTIDELKEQIDKELSSNPALELKEERRCPTCHRLLPERTVCPVCSRPQNVNPDEPVVFVSPREDFYTSSHQTDDYMAEEQDYSPVSQDLPTYVLRQIAPELAVEDRKLAAYLLAHLDEDGLLTIKPVEVALYYHIPLSRVEAVRKMIQRADPIGVGSVSTQEALLVQIETLKDSMHVPDLARLIVTSGMHSLSHRQYADLARQFDVPVKQVQLAVKFISENLNPFPGRSHWGDVRQPSSAGVEVYHRPDIIISYLNDDIENPLVVEIVMPVSGTLHVNPLFREAIHLAEDDNKDAMRNDYDRASLFVKCMQQRNHTMTRMMFRLVVMQKDFILNGNKHLKPVTRVSISKDLDVHESTISRAVSGKTVQLPNKKIVPLSSFFDRSLNVRTILKDIITQEAKPLSDSELVDLLAKKGFDVARRTVAKYRSMEGILPAHLRRSISRVS